MTAYSDLNRASAAMKKSTEVEIPVPYKKKKEATEPDTTPEENIFNNITQEEWSTANLTCPGIPIDYSVVWLNKTRAIDVNANGSRTTLHANNDLEIYPLILEDSGMYYCMSDGVTVAKVKVVVLPRFGITREMWRYALMASYTYPADFLVFLVIMAVKHKSRQRGLYLTDDQLSDIDSMSCSDSGSSSSSASNSNSTSNTCTSSSNGTSTKT